MAAAVTQTTPRDSEIEAAIDFSSGAWARGAHLDPPAKLELTEGVARNLWRFKQGAIREARDLLDPLGEDPPLNSEALRGIVECAGVIVQQRFGFGPLSPEEAITLAAEVVGEAVRRVERDAVRREQARANDTTTDGPDNERAGMVEPEPAPDAMWRETDTGVAKRFVTEFGDRLRFVDPLGGWLLYDGERWVKDEIGEVYRLIDRTAAAIWAALATVPLRRRKNWAKFAARSESAHGKAAALTLARYEPPIAARAVDFDANPWLLNLKNGTLNLQTDEFAPHSPTDLLLKIAPVTYDPRATAPVFFAFLERIMAGRQALVAFLQRFVGYCLTGDISEQVFLLWSGVGANGKSTLVDILRGVLGDYAFAADFSTFLSDSRNVRAPREDIARLAGARLVSAIEQNVTGKLDEGLIKKITGNDPLVARHLYKGSFEFIPTFKVILACNHRPNIGGSDHAMWRRVWCVPFDVTFPREEWDKHFAERLVAREASGILNWALEGLRQWRAAGDLRAPAEVLTASNEYRESQDILGPFLAEYCIIGESHTAGATPLYNAYTCWATTAGECVESQRQFGEWLRERGFRSDRVTAGPNKGRTFYLGLALRDPGDGEG